MFFQWKKPPHVHLAKMPSPKGQGSKAGEVSTQRLVVAFASAKDDKQITKIHTILSERFDVAYFFEIYVRIYSWDWLLMWHDVTIE